jgi:hypothetical protein
MRGLRAGALTGCAAPAPSGRRPVLHRFIAGCCSLLWVVLSATAQGQPLSVDERAVGGVLESLKAPTATEPPVVHQTEEGFIRFLGAPPGGHFIAREDDKSVGVEGTATTFLLDHAKAFGALSTSTNFKPGNVLAHGNDSYVRLNQYYGDLPATTGGFATS